MKCNNHPNHEAVHFCASCGIPLCDDCVEEPIPGQFFCFQCAMVQAVSGAGTSLKGKREKHTEKELDKKKPWGPFRYFVVLSSVLIAVMWGVIIFGGQQAPVEAMDVTKNERVFLFMVDSCIKRYANHQKGNYPESLMDIVPKYLPLRGDNLIYLERLSYKKDPQEGYLLSLVNTKPGEMKIIISAKRIRYASSSKEGA